MSAAKKIKLTDHFRVALKPRDQNIKPPKVSLAKVQQQGQEFRSLKDDLEQDSQERKKAQKLQQLPTLVKTFATSKQEKSLQPPIATKTIIAKQGKIVLEPTIPKATTTTTNESTTVTTAATTIVAIAAAASKQEKLLQPPPINLNKYIEPPGKSANIVDFDKCSLNNVFWESHYAWESFQYDRQQEVRLRDELLLHRKVDLSDLDNNNDSFSLFATGAPRRAELVDWLVDIQMRFSLDHEPLYMAVKLADHYLTRKFVSQDQYILLFLTSILISAKYDERVPPVTIADLIHLSRSKFGVRYTRKQMISLEVDLLNTLNFDIRFPLSYGFLRRFARCMRSDMRTIHLARYILESSLLDYDMIEILDSKIAAGSLLLAIEMLHYQTTVQPLQATKRINSATNISKMGNDSQTSFGSTRATTTTTPKMTSSIWDETAIYYTGYHERELYPLVTRLNRLLVKLSRKKTAIRRKYSHESFMEVARIPPLLPEVLLTFLSNRT